MQDVLGVVDLGGTGVQLNVSVIAHDQCAVITQTDVAIELTAAFSLIQAGFFSLDLHAALAHDNVTGQGGDL